MIVETNNIVTNILHNLSDYFPQTPVVGGTLRMKANINEINRIEDE